MGILAGIGVLVPFPFYYFLWTYPQSWVNFCGKGRDPSKVMALVSHFFKLVQFISLFSVCSLSWPPPLYFWPLFAFGQFLNFRSVALYLYTMLRGMPPPLYFWPLFTFYFLLFGLESAFLAKYYCGEFFFIHNQI